MPYWRVKLPPGVRSPFEVYVNGVRQELGPDYPDRRGELLFERELVRQKLERLGVVPRLLGNRDLQAQRRDRRALRGRRPAAARARAGRHSAVLTTSRRTHGRSSRSAARIARVAGERFSV